MPSTVAKIFITRIIAPDHPDRLSIESQGHELMGRSMLSFTYLPIALPQQKIDWWFAYSRHAVKGLCASQNFFEALRQNPHWKFAAIGVGTAKAWQAAGLQADFIGGGSPQEVASQFSSHAQGKTVCFVQAEQSRQSIQTLLGDVCGAIDVVSYRAQEDSKVEVPSIDVALLTSPRSASLLLSKLPLGCRPQIFCIGHPTAEAVRNLGFQVAGCPGEANISSLLGMAVATS